MRALLAAAVAALALLAAPLDPAVAVPPSAEQPSARPAAAPRPHADLSRDHRGVVLDRAAETAGRRAGVAWPRGEIRYYEAIPAKWQWGLDRAIEHWNSSGAKVRFVKVSSRKRAQVTIGYGQTYGADGLGGWTARGNTIFKGFVHINASYKKVDEKDDEQRVWMGRLISHELGHVLGYDHTSGTCSLMAPIFYFGTCGPLSVGKPGYYQCRWIDTALLRAHVKKYGGRARRPAQHCLVHPLPAELKGVRFSGGAGEARTRITWTRPARPRALEKVVVEVWPTTGSCAKKPSSAEQYPRSVTATSWVDPREGAGDHCFRIRAVNHAGIGPAGVTRRLARINVAPPRPVISQVGYRKTETRFVFSATVGDDEDLLYLGGASLGDPTACPPTVDPAGSDHQVAYETSSGRYELYPSVAVECVTFVVVNRFGKASAPTSVTFTVPPPDPTAPTLGTPVRSEDGYWTVTATAPGGAPVGLEVRGGTCPTTPPTDLSLSSDPYDDQGRYYVYPYEEGANCVFAAVEDGYGRRSAVAMVGWDVTF